MFIIWIAIWLMHFVLALGIIEKCLYSKRGSIIVCWVTAVCSLDQMKLCVISYAPAAIYF